MTEVRKRPRPRRHTSADSWPSWTDDIRFGLGPKSAISLPAIPAPHGTTLTLRVRLVPDRPEPAGVGEC